MCIETALKQVGKAQFSTGSDIILLLHWLSMSIHDWWSSKLGNVRARDVLQHLAPWAAVSTCPARTLTKVRSAYQWSYGSRQKKDPFKIECHLYLQQHHIKVTWTWGKKKPCHHLPLGCNDCDFYLYINYTSFHVFPIPSPGSQLQRQAPCTRELPGSFSLTEAVGNWSHWNRIWSTTSDRYIGT